MATSVSRLLSAKVDFHRALHGWYRTHARRLPWRESPSLYKTVVSEFMLQQTQVKTVLPYFARWLAALPDFAALAAAPDAQVLKLWEGLGYYSRARNLHRLAREIAARPAPPRTPAEWRELPGVGPYTAAAVTSISFDAPVACVDGNVVRILARLTANATEFRDSAGAAKVFAPLAGALLPADAPGEHNQAMMELGATVCLRQNPLCPTCPVRAFCAAARRGAPEAFPRIAPRQIEHRSVTRVWCERNGALLLHRAPAGAKRFAHMHELPLADQTGVAPAVARRGRLLAQKRRAITRFQIVESIHLAPPPRRKMAADLVWVPLVELDAITLSGPHRRWVTEILAARTMACRQNAGASWRKP
ncbi:MAG: A/G-specific adenine glycosylase [Verrucomicrobia bacterium]|nr:A/G-specific adenine glycosylase [Verrucomicrobiota bacterium]